MSMYIRVKRQKTTVFLQVEPTDTVLEVKQKLQKQLDKSPDKMQLHRLVGADQYVPLDDAKKLADLKVENDDVVAMCYLREDGIGFEQIKICAPGAEGDAEPGTAEDSGAKKADDAVKAEGQ